MKMRMKMTKMRTNSLKIARKIKMKKNEKNINDVDETSDDDDKNTEKSDFFDF